MTPFFASSFAKAMEDRKATQGRQGVNFGMRIPPRLRRVNFGGETGDGGRIMLQRILCNKMLELANGRGHNSSYIRKVKI